MPSKKVDGEGRNSKRVFLSSVEERARWLTRKAEQGGFQLAWCREDGQRRSVVAARVGSKATVHTGVRFRGELIITDSARFLEAFQTGIGSERAYGMGMLMLFPAGV